MSRRPAYHKESKMQLARIQEIKEMTVSAVERSKEIKEQRKLQEDAYPDFCNYLKPAIGLSETEFVFGRSDSNT